ncbi:JmjC domain-containing histone demethylation protein 1 [Exophiala dermatitidis]
MPTSTVWRCFGDLLGPRGVSPIRPSRDFIESLSPEPTLESSAADEPLLPPHTSQANGASLTGLGLCDVEIAEEVAVTVQPNHLYYDEDGSAHIGARIVSGAAPQTRRSLQDLRENPLRNFKSTPDTRTSRGKGHTRSGSTIDDLASAAIATSPDLGEPNTPSFRKASPFTATRPSTSYIHRFDRDNSSNGPPTKRIKSERLPNLEWSPRADRPRTSGVDSTTDITYEDALLLLELKNEVNFKNGTTPQLTSATLNGQPHSSHTPRRYSEASTIRDSPSAQLQQTLQADNVENEEVKVSKERQIHSAVDAWQTQNSRLSHPQPETSSAQTANATIGGTPQAKTIGTAAEPQAKRSPQVASRPTSSSKRQRRVKPEVQAEVCAACNRLQLDTVDDENSVMFWISCDACNRWFHAECAGFKTKAEARSVDKYLCKECEPVHGKTTFVRKSTRPRTAIDYAGLHQGVVKSSVESPTHHYIQPIKEGKIALLPDDFARVRPEVLTMQFMENFDGMKRPFVVPACWNPRFGAKLPLKEAESDGPRFTRIDSLGNPAGVEEPVSDEVVEEEVLDCGQDLLDMVIPRNLTVRKVAELYGLDEPVPVIDVKSQETKGQFTLQQWADYYELAGEKPILNVISLEVSQSPLGKLIRRPKVVRDLDLEDHVWDGDTETRTKKRPVQFYCLMSVADSYTDFHIDFGGSSVYYHILKGTKTFFFIPPEDKYLKKYEDWCNSDTQNETWLGDLCGGNCTRVDLHEGDTAFIPAGWIHAVWTPEDSLVIGGNFLTRIDYELQLKVANVERVTKVAPKFRYPYFQKVMWYTLIKYLEEDPLPDEVLTDFRDDPDYVFLRANPLWHEIDDLANTAEPGEPAFNARYYPKAEVAGWPALRDYLYRTARIDAGLPVADITKKQIDAVKASIPKGHGDPLTLIKLFAIWCAWKMGNVPAPDWVHSDGALEPEKADKVKKAETFRLPGERTSSRRAAQALAQAQTPQPEVSAPLPAKQSAKSTPKGNGLKVACEPCRKRRIKCRHKSGSETPTRPAPEIRPRSFSNADVPSTAAVDQNGFSNEQPTPPAMRLSEPAANHAETVQTVTANADAQSSSKKTRTKACEECRKSKRRCVHDEHGRVDPAKAAEPSKPRGSTSSKRPARFSDESADNKRERMDGELLDGLIDPALTNDNVLLANEAVEDSPATPAPLLETEPDDKVSGQNIAEGASTSQHAGSETLPSQAIPVDPALEAMTAMPTAVIKSEADSDDNQPLNHDADMADLTPKEGGGGGEFSTPAPVKRASSINAGFSGMPNSPPASRHSSRQPKQVERYTPEDKRSPTKPLPKPPRSDRRASSAASAQTMVNSVKSRRSSSNTSGTVHQMAGNMVRRSQSGEASARPVSRDSTGGESDMDADEKFARELQAAENGLRRRTSMRA